MNLIASYQNQGYQAVADGVTDFFNRRTDLHRNGVAFGQGESNSNEVPVKTSTDISLVGIDRSDPEAFALSDLILRGVDAALNQYLLERPLMRDCSPGCSLFVNPIFNIQRYAPGEGFKQWHCDWTITEELTEPINRVLAWILYCNNVESAGTEFFWQDHYESAEKGKMILFPAGLSHIHRGRVSQINTKTIATGWINVGTFQEYIARLAQN